MKPKHDGDRELVKGYVTGFWWAVLLIGLDRMLLGWSDWRDTLWIGGFFGGVGILKVMAIIRDSRDDPDDEDYRHRHRHP